MARIAGKRISWFYFGALIISVTIFNIFTPHGVLLIEIMGVPITVGGLRNGLHKGLLVCALVFCSLATVRKELRFPGKLGALLAYIFIYFDLLFAKKKTLRLTRLLRDIDNVLLDLLATQRAHTSRMRTHRDRYNMGAWRIAVSHASLFYAPHIILFVIPYFLNIENILIE